MKQRKFIKEYKGQCPTDPNALSNQADISSLDLKIRMFKRLMITDKDV